jgi:hypothetical protein
MSLWMISALHLLFFFRDKFKGDTVRTQFLYRQLPKLPPAACRLSAAIDYNIYENKALAFNGRDSAIWHPNCYTQCRLEYGRCFQMQLFEATSASDVASEVMLNSQLICD